MPRVLVVQPDAEFGESLRAILQGQLSLEFLAANQLAEAQSALELTGPVDVLVTEGYFPEEDAPAFIAQFGATYPNALVLIATRYDLSEYRAYWGDLPEIYPGDAATLIAYVSDHLNLMEGITWHQYRIEKRLYVGIWGPVYQAYHLPVKRMAYLTLLRAGAGEDEVRRFQESAAYLAQASHPNVTAVYEGGEYDSRHYYLHELWAIPSLTEYEQQGRTIEPRMAARVIHVCTTVLVFWETNRYLHPIIQPEHITLTNTGVVKLLNIVDPTLDRSGDLREQMRVLAATIRRLLPTGVELPVKLTGLLAAMEQEGLTVNQIGLSAQALDAELAPKQVVVKTKEQVEAEQALERSKRQREAVLQMVAGVLVSAVLAAGVLLFLKFREPPSHEYLKMLRIPAGSFPFQDGSPVEVKEFWLDEYEVTIGQYKKFLVSIKGKDMSAWEHPDVKGQTRAYAPAEWVGMIDCIREEKPFSNQMLTLDSPVFGVDYYSAYAYAKWAKKRLPTEQEWERAARGPKFYKYPWGNEMDYKRANAGFGFFLGAPERAIAADGYYGVCPVDAKDSDESPYGVKGLAGNVSEWTASEGPEQLGLVTQVIRGGNFQTTKIENTQRIYKIRDTRERWLGFRCASDTPPAQKK